jgi:hypothetical protein
LLVHSAEVSKLAITFQEYKGAEGIILPVLFKGGPMRDQPTRAITAMWRAIRQKYAIFSLLTWKVRTAFDSSESLSDHPAAGARSKTNRLLRRGSILHRLR